MNNINPQTDEFFIGYVNNIPPKIRKFLWVLIPTLVAVSIILGLVLPKVHNQFTDGRYTKFQEFEGLLIDKPIPHLVVPRSGKINEENGYSRYILAGTRKTAVNDQVLKLAGNWVKLRAIPVFRDNMTLLAVSSKTPPEAIEPPKLETPPSLEGKSLGQYTLQGEIVDTKCYLGVMNPGHTKTHKECAIRCLSGGVPATFRVVNQDGQVYYFLLVDSQGNALDKSNFNLVSEPVQIIGEVIKYGDLFVLKGEPTRV